MEIGVCSKQWMRRGIYYARIYEAASSFSMEGRKYFAVYASSQCHVVLDVSYQTSA